MQGITSLSYFHGTIDIRECRELLLELGDFLVRINVRGIKKSDEGMVLLTVAVSPDQASANSKNMPKDWSLKDTFTTRLKTYEIQEKADQFTLQGTQIPFPSIESLCDHFIQTKKRLPSGGVLVKAVFRKPWELMSNVLELPPVEVILGSGAYGKVIKGRLTKSDGSQIDVAVKKTKNEKGDDVIAEMFAEARTMRALIHPNIIRIEGVVIEKLPVLVVMEFMEGSSLLSALRKKKVPNHFRFPISVGILYGLLYMHTQTYIHRDIAARNVMVSSDFRTVKIIDFGLSKHSIHFNQGVTQKIPVKWLAPEVLRTWHFSTKSDTWAYGVTVWEIFHDGVEPYYSKVQSAPMTAPPVGKGSVNRKKSRGNNALEITENLDYLPKDFLPLYKRLFTKMVRDRIELAAMADEIEKKIVPTLPKIVGDEVRTHMEKRLAFNPKFAPQINLPRSDMGVAPKTTPQKTPPTPGPAPTKLKTIKREGMGGERRQRSEPTNNPQTAPQTENKEPKGKVK